MKKLTQILFILSLGLMLLNPVVVFAQAKSSTVANIPQYNGGADTSVTQYLCTPSSPPDGHDLERCINRAYRFGISFGAIALVFFIVLAGYMYLSGGESGKEKGKMILKNALAGVALLLSSYLI